MIRSLLLLSLGAVVGLACAQVMSKKSTIVVTSALPTNLNDYAESRFDGKRIYTAVSDDIVNSPHWSPGIELPVNFHEAVSLGIKGLNKALQSSDSKVVPWKISCVSLLPYSEEIWFWKVTFENTVDNNIQAGAGKVRIDEIQVIIDMKRNVVVPNVTE